MSEQQVLQLLGEPYRRDAVFYLGQRQGFEAAYEQAARSQSTYYFHWRRGIDVVYTVGFDERQRVTVASSGGT